MFVLVYLLDSIFFCLSKIFSFFIFFKVKHKGAACHTNSRPFVFIRKRTNLTDGVRNDGVVLFRLQIETLKTTLTLLHLRCLS